MVDDADASLLSTVRWIAEILFGALAALRMFIGHEIAAMHGIRSTLY